MVEARDATHVGYVALSPLEDDLECNMLPVVDVLNDERVWGVLDEGCNSTVCGHEWMETCKAKLKNMGFEVPAEGIQRSCRECAHQGWMQNPICVGT